ncbi:MAG: primosomal protein N' [Kangiellaceae bacterium]|nr:primosomal protein N' [Kangiellaceae bacterium]
MPLEPSDSQSLIVSVAVPVPLRRCFDYVLAQQTPFELLPGMRVKVPFGKTFKIGVVESVKTIHQAKEESQEFSIDKLKPIHTIVDQTPLLDKALLNLYQWMEGYYHAPPGEIWQTILPTALMKGADTKISRDSLWRITEQGNEALRTNKVASNAVKQRKSLQVLSENDNGIGQQQLKAFGLESATLKKLAGKNWVEQSFDIDSKENQGKLINASNLVELNPQQKEAVTAVSDQITRFNSFLLFGVTASGKTEVYLRLIEKVLEQGRQALVLVPEIGLTPQTVKRFENRFKVDILTMHSGMTDLQRLQSWLKARSGQARIIIGTRSAVFVPMKEPGIIIIDEEHDRSFRQQQGFRYSARDVALVRASMQNIPILLGSATPSVESLLNVSKGKITQLDLPNKAKSESQIKFRLIDLKKQVLRQGLSVDLIESMRKHLDKQGQVLLFLNRRGYAPVLLCHQCGWSQHCTRCDIHFTYHHQNHFLQCHHCGSHRKAPSQCPQCDCDQMVPVGLGTERLEETVKQMFPKANVARIDRDTTRRKTAMKDFVSSIKQGEVDILIGTQMLAKGHHFPNVTLVGLIDMDGALYSADFRAPEYAAQLITQVAGRAGRAGKAGEVLIQTHHTEHPMLQQLLTEGYQHFARLAIRERIEAELPPHAFSAMFQAEAPRIDQVKTFLNEVRQILNRYSDLKVDLLGPAPALYVKKAGKFRYQLLLQTDKRNELHRLLELTLGDIERLKSAARVRWRVEIDPIGDS